MVSDMETFSTLSTPSLRKVKELKMEFKKQNLEMHWEHLKKKMSSQSLEIPELQQLDSFNKIENSLDL